MNVEIEILRIRAFSVILHAAESRKWIRTDCWHSQCDAKEDWQLRTTNVDVRRLMNNTENIVHAVINHRRKNAIELCGHI